MLVMAESLTVLIGTQQHGRESTMSIRGRFFAASYDRQMKRAEKAGLAEMRQGLLAQASGRVLEIGGGTGANLAHYGPAVTSLTITEPEVPMLKRLERRAGTEAPSAVVLRAPAEDLPFDDGTFDVVVSTLVLCGVDDQPRAVREIRRVLRPEGRLLFFEHVRSSDPKVARRQDHINWLNQIVVCCDCNRPTLDTIEEAGFEVSSLEHTALPKAPSFARPAIRGVATAPVVSVPRADAGVRP
jgi:ubiquinone/menaquinone biosynthesis C-methylase UbiE